MTIPSEADRKSREMGLGYALGGAVALLLVPVLGFWALKGLFGTGTVDPLALGVLGILGIVTLVAALGALVLIAGALGISDKRYSLGLPQGSVRAIIALTVAITFLILAVTIPQSLLAPGVNDAANDLNKQIITVISTLLVAVVSFYFGSRTVAQAREIVNENRPNGTTANASDNAGGGGSEAEKDKESEETKPSTA